MKRLNSVSKLKMGEREMRRHIENTEAKKTIRVSPWEFSILF